MTGLVQQGHPEPATNLTAERRHDAQRRFIGRQQRIHQGNRIRRPARQQRIPHRQAAGAHAAHQRPHRLGRDRPPRPRRAPVGMQAQLLQFTGQPGAVAADRLGQGFRRRRRQFQAHLAGGALHQLQLAGAIPHRRQLEAALAGLAALNQGLQRLGGAQPAVGLGRLHQHQMAIGGDQGQARLQLLAQLGGALLAKGTALQQHQPGPSPEGRRARLRQGLGRLGQVIAIQPAEVDGAPGRIHQLFHQGIQGSLAGGLVVAPEQVDRHAG